MRFNIKGSEFLIDDENSDLTKLNWNLHTYGYAMTKYKGRTTYLHQLVIGRQKRGFVIDHINRDVTDNRRENLRVLSIRDNLLNSKLFNTNTSGVKGVHQSKRSKPFEAYIHVNRKKINLGRYKTLEEAASVRRVAELKYFGGLQ